MIQKKTIILAVVLIAIVIIQLNDGLTIKKVRENFRCALRRRRLQLLQTTTTDSQITTNKETTTINSTKTIDESFKLEQMCNPRGFESFLSNDTIKSKLKIISKYIC